MHTIETDATRTIVIHVEPKKLMLGYSEESPRPVAALALEDGELPIVLTAIDAMQEQGTTPYIAWQVMRAQIVLAVDPPTAAVRRLVRNMRVFASVADRMPAFIVEASMEIDTSNLAFGRFVELFNRRKEVELCVVGSDLDLDHPCARVRVTELRSQLYRFRF